MSFKKRMIIVTISCAFAIIVLTASVVAVFANNNLLVKTNVSVSYTAPDLSEAYVSASVWRSDASEKTEVFASTNATQLTTAQTVPAVKLTERNTYVVYEMSVENKSAQDKYYVEERFKKTNTTAISNMKLEYCTVSETPLEVNEVLSEEYVELNDVSIFGGTRLVHNAILDPNDKLYIYTVVSIKDIALNGSFSGSFICNIGLDPFDEREQIDIINRSVKNYYTTAYIPTIQMGEMPQSYAGTDDSLYTITEDVYTECGVSYNIYVDGNGKRYAKKDGAYYLFEPILWHVLGTYDSTSQHTTISSYFEGLYKAKDFTSLVVVPTKILFYCAWNSTLTRVNYPNSTICSALNEFYTNVLGDYQDYINTTNTLYYNNAETSIQTSMGDAAAVATSQKLFLFTTSQVKGWFSNTYKKRYNTAWAEGVETPSYGKYWLRTNQYNNTDGEVFLANAVGTDANIVATNINEVCGVLPVMVVNLP